VTTINDFIGELKGKVKLPAPILDFNQGDDVYVSLVNLGLVMRPDLDDSHTIHWHGFRNPNAIYDGVPETSISVPVARIFSYFYRPRDPGTYMYHCHFEDTEHVQMGMDGIVFIRPSQDGTSIGPFNRFAYNDGDGSTGYHREFTLLLNEIDTTPHDGLVAVQEFIWSDYKANYWVINGRSYPDTIVRDQDLGSTDFEDTQPVSSLIQVNEGETGLLRFVNLGYEQQAMQLPGIRMQVVGEDATLLRGPDGDSLYYDTTTLYIGPGEARDVLFTAPAFDSGGPGGSDSYGSYNIYWLKNRNSHRLVNGTEPGLGGQVTQIWVYEAGSLPSQTGPNKTF
jgi:FtsP/CotA-like multicopper oxidase with cupredoxin domain